MSDKAKFRDIGFELGGRYPGSQVSVEATLKSLKEYPPDRDVETKEYRIPLDKYRHWYAIIRNDDIKAFGQVKSAANEEQMEALREGVFYQEEKKQVDGRPGDFKRIFLLACVFSAKQILEQLMKDGVDVTKTGDGERNWVHAIIITAAGCRSQEDAMIDIYRFLMNSLTHEQRLKLLCDEDKHHFRPLELSAKLQTFGLLQIIIEAEGLLLVKREERGLYKTQTYDVSEYEDFQNFRRGYRSPLQMLCFITQDNIERISNYKLDKNAFLQEWIWFKIRRNLPFLLIWFLFRVLFVIFLILVNPAVLVAMARLPYCQGLSTSQVSGTNAIDTECAAVNGSGVTFNIAVAALMFTCSFVILYDFLEVIWKIVDRDRKTAFTGLGMIIGKKYFSFTYFYRIIQFMLNVVALLTVVIAYTDLNSLVAHRFLKSIYIPLAVLSILYVIEAIPYIGVFVITLQRMISVMVYFVLFSIVVKLAFQIGYFQQVYERDETFNTTANGLYTMFILENGVGDLGTVLDIPTASAYVTYFYFSGVLLINYLIAAMSVVAETVSESGDFIQSIRRLDAALTVEERFGRWFYLLLHKCSKKPPRKMLISVTDTIYE